jgi:3-methyladenine DNA glycosylase AlkD
VKARSTKATAGTGASSKPKKSVGTTSGQTAVEAALEWLREHSSEATRDAMARYAIPSEGALGVTVRDIKVLAKKLGRNHALALKLWETGIYEARMLASLVGEPKALTEAEMERWCKELDNWAICDSLCFNLFVRSPYAWKKVKAWSRRREEFEKRAAFALLWTLTVHDKAAPDEAFPEGLALIEREASDERHFVKKAVNMALRAVGKRNRELQAAAMEVAERLAASKDATARWVGSHALRELKSPMVAERVKKRSRGQV